MIYNLIDELEKRSSHIRGMKLKTELSNSELSEHPFNLATNPDDLDTICCTLDHLISACGLTINDAKSLVRTLTNQRSFYGSYCELRAYGWLHRQGVNFHTQIPLTNVDVLNPNGCKIDGRINKPLIYFDIKAFGFQEYVTERFRSSLEERLPGMTVTIDGSMDLDVTDISEHAFRTIESLATSMKNGGTHQISQLNWTIHVKRSQSVSSSIQEINPYCLAKENRYYPFRSARQFTRNDAFLLVFPYSTAFNRWMGQDFVGSTEITLRSLARRAFMQMCHDQTSASKFDKSVANNVTVADAAKLLSALLFIDLDKETTGWLFLNPRATHRLTKYHMDQIFGFLWPHSLVFDDFGYDNY